MSCIYYDIYMTDEVVKSSYKYRRMADTMRVYEPIFNKYGYTTDDYNRSVSFYLKRPDKFQEVFENTKMMLEKRKAELQKILEAEGMRPRLWPLVDSLELYTADGIHAGMPYKIMRIMFFKPDSTLPMSPAPDSAFMERPADRYLIFTDSAMHADKDFYFYKAKDFMSEVRRMIEVRDSLLMAADSTMTEDDRDAVNSNTTGMTPRTLRNVIDQTDNTITRPGKPPIIINPKDNKDNRTSIRRQNKTK